MGKISCAMLGLALAASLSVETIGISSRQPRSYEIDFVAEKPDVEVLAAQMSKRRDPEVGVTNLSVWEEGDGPVPFQLMLAALDRPGYAIGERFIFDVVLKHVGSKPFAFPWSRDHRGIRRSVPNARKASIMLSFKDSVLGTQLLGAENTTYGAPSIPNSLVMLEPGDTLRIRATGEWYLGAGTPAPPPDEWVRDLTISAQLQIHGLTRFQPLVNSTNTVGIQLRQHR